MRLTHTYGAQQLLSTTVLMLTHSAAIPHGQARRARIERGTAQAWCLLFSRSLHEFQWVFFPSPQAHRAHIELVTAKVERSLLQDTTADLVRAAAGA